jgi:anaerobic magnesium-protoporphyrin IX monomethyl ester cyclase
MAKDTVVLFHPRSYPRDIPKAIPYEFLHLERMVRGKVRMIFIDEQLDKDYLKLIEDIKENILLVGVSSMTGYQLLGGLNFSKTIKSLGNIKVVWGGWHASLLPEQVLKEDFVDFVICGQGEFAFQRLVESLINNSPFEAIPNLCYKKGCEMYFNPKEKVVDPFQLPPIDLSLIDVSRYVTHKKVSDRSIWYFMSYGCPNSCSFCAMASVYGKAWWHRPLDEVISHLKYLKEKTDMQGVVLMDPTFFVNREFTLELCRRIIESGIKFHWRANAQAKRFIQLFSHDDINLMYQAGLRQVFVGAESGDPEVLEKIDKRSTVEDNLEIVRLLKPHGIISTHGIMVCFPWNPDRDFKSSIKMVMKAKLIDAKLEVFLNIFHPLPGTPIFKDAIEHGFVAPENINEWADFSLHRFIPPWTKHDYMIRLRILKKIFFPLLTPGVYRTLTGVRKIIFLIAVFFLRPIIRMRFRFGTMKFPIEGYIIYYMMKTFNIVTGLRWGMGKEQHYQHKDI